MCKLCIFFGSQGSPQNKSWFSKHHTQRIIYILCLCHCQLSLQRGFRSPQSGFLPPALGRMLECFQTMPRECPEAAMQIQIVTRVHKVSPFAPLGPGLGSNNSSSPPPSALSLSLSLSLSPPVHLSATLPHSASLPFFPLLLHPSSLPPSFHPPSSLSPPLLPTSPKTLTSLSATH